MGGIVRPKNDSLLNELARASKRMLTFARSRRFNAVEIERFAADVGIAQRRLVTREYAQSSFQPRNLLRIADRTDELFKDLTFYWSVGQVWRDILERVIPPAVHSVAEVGCGSVPKVPLGLHYLNFMGTVDLIDSDEAILSQAGNFLELFGARFECVRRAVAIAEAPQEAYDVVFANHLLDDLVLSYYCAVKSEGPISLYQNEGSYAAIWNQIVQGARLVRAPLGKSVTYDRLEVREEDLIVVRKQEAP